MKTQTKFLKASSEALDFLLRWPGVFGAMRQGALTVRGYGYPIRTQKRVP